MNKFYSRIYKLFSGLVKRAYRIKVIGSENEPENGPFLVCANHISNQDVVILAASLKHQVRFLAKAELFRIPLFGRFIRALGAYPVERGKGDVGAIKNTLRLIDEGEVVGIYPQGHRYAGMHPADSEVKGGIGLILTKKQIPVLPVAIQTGKFRVRIFKKTKVVIGKPVYLNAPLGEISGKRNEYYNGISEAVFERICGLIDASAYPQPKAPRFLTDGKKSELLRELSETEAEKAIGESISSENVSKENVSNENASGENAGNESVSDGHLSEEAPLNAEAANEGVGGAAEG